MQFGRVDVVFDPDPGHHRIDLVGELDLSTAVIVSAYVARHVFDDCDADWELGLDRVEFMDSAGLKVLVVARQNLGPCGSITLVDPSPALARLLETSGLDHAFPVRTTPTAGAA